MHKSSTISLTHNPTWNVNISLYWVERQVEGLGEPRRAPLTLNHKPLPTRARSPCGSRADSYIQLLHYYAVAAVTSVFPVRSESTPRSN